MTDKLDVIQARRTRANRARAEFKRKYHRAMTVEKTVHERDIDFLLDLLRAQQAKLDDCAEMAAMWHDKSGGETFTQQMLLFCSDELRKALNG